MRRDAGAALLSKVLVELPEISEEVVGEQLAVEHVVDAAHLADAVHGQLRHAHVHRACRESDMDGG